MEQQCGVNGDKKYTQKPGEIFDKLTELQILKQGDITEEECERDIKRHSKFSKGKGGNLFMGTYYLKYLLEEERTITRRETKEQWSCT